MRSEEKKKPLHLGFLTALGNPIDGLIGGFLILNPVGRPTEFHCTAPIRPNRAQEILYGNTLEGFVCGEQIAPALVGRTKTELAAILTNNPNMLTAPRALNAPIGLVFKHVVSENFDKEKYALWDGDDVLKEGTDEKLSDDKSQELTDAERSVIPSVEQSEQVSDVSSRFSIRQTFFFESLDLAPFVPGVDYSRWQEVVRGKNRMALPNSFISEGTGKLSFENIVARIEPFLKAIDSVEPFERIRLAIEEAQKSC